MVLPESILQPAAVILPRSGHTALTKLQSLKMGAGVEGIVDADRPGLPVIFHLADSNIATGIHQRRPEVGKAPDCLVSRPALGNAAQVKTDGIGQNQAARGGIPYNDAGRVRHPRP